jgi:hypothetical protein
MTEAEATQCATIAAALTALFALTRGESGRLSLGLTAFFALSAVCDAVLLAWPRLWTPESYAVREVGVAFLAAIAVLELGRGVLRPAARVWRAVCRRAALSLVPLSAIGLWGLFTLAGAPRAGYRGVVVVDAAAAALGAFVLSAVSLYELPRHPVTMPALRALLVYLAAQVVYLGSWEASRRLAELLTWPATLTFVWAALSIARSALSTTPRPKLLPVGVNR